jgi:hypothetical protein
MGEMRNAFNTLIRKPEGWRPLRKLRHRWEDNIKMDLKEIGCKGMGWAQLAYYWNHWWVFVNLVMNMNLGFHKK